MNDYNKLKTEILEIIYKSEYEKAIKESYKTKFIFNKEKNKLRKIEKPNDILKKNFQKLLTIALQNNIEHLINYHMVILLFTDFTNYSITQILHKK